MTFFDETRNKEKSFNALREGSLSKKTKRLKQNVNLNNFDATAGCDLEDQDFINDSGTEIQQTELQLMEIIQQLQAENESLKSENAELKLAVAAHDRLKTALATQQKEIMELKKIIESSQHSQLRNLDSLIDSKVRELLTNYRTTRPPLSIQQRQNSTEPLPSSSAMESPPKATTEVTYANATKKLLRGPTKLSAIKRNVVKAQETLNALDESHSPEEIKEISLRMLTGFDPINKQPLKPRVPVFKRMQQRITEYKNEKLIAQVKDSTVVLIKGIHRNKISLIKSVFEKNGINRTEVKHLTFISNSTLMIICQKDAAKKFSSLCDDNDALTFSTEIEIESLLLVTRNEIKKPIRLDCAVLLQSMLPCEQQADIFPFVDPVAVLTKLTEETIASDEDAMETI
jgi:hypothetical protein